MRRIKIILSFILVLFVQAVSSQTYPVQLNAQLIPPYSGYLPDYADPSSEKLKVIIQFNDFSRPQYDLRLKIEIKGNGFTLVTKQLFSPPPLSVQPGVPLLLSGTDLAPYLNSNNLDFIGISQAQYEQRMALPEGYYSVCVKAYDYYNPGNIQVSNEACTQAWFTLSDPPFLNLPQCGLSVTPQTPQNLIFQWTPMNMSSPNSALNTEYEFGLWEMRPDSSANPNQVVMSTAPIFSTTTNLTLLNYGIAEPSLNLYMKYAWRVRAKDITGRDWFKNNGYSQVCTFVYGTAQTVLGNALNLNLTAQGLTHRLAKCTWNTQSVYTKYLLQVRKEGTPHWFDYNCNAGTEKVTNLEPNTNYEARVRGEGAVIGDWSNIATFNTFSEPNYSCNDQTQIIDPLQAQPLPPNKAVAGMIIQTGQFEVVVSNIYPAGPPGWFSGKGYAKVFGGLPLSVQFNNIYIDDNNRHQQGIIHAETKGIENWLHQWDVKDAEENATYVNGEIDSIYVNGNQICVVIQGKQEDSCFTYPPDQNVIVVRDENGNQYNVQVNPPPPKITGPFNYTHPSNDSLAADDNTIVEFVQSPVQQNGFDRKQYTAWTNNYELIKLKNGKNYFVPIKGVAENNTNEEVHAAINIIGFDASKLSFKTDAGLQLNASLVTGNNLYKMNIPHQAKSVYAWYDGKKVGKLNVVKLKSISKKLVIIPVNGASLSASNLTADLNKIFAQANVNWSVTVKGSYTYSLGNDGLEAADATLMSKYSPEMRALRDAYKAAVPDYDKDAYYIFVVNNFSDPSIKGYMVRGRALGFVTASASAKEIAHELAHGAFGLEHTFPAIQKNSSGNLMDYGSGDELSAKQWEEMHNSGFICTWLDKEEDGSLNKDCHAGLTPSGRMFDECYDEQGNKLNTTHCIKQGNYCVTSILYKNERYNWDNSLGLYIHSGSEKTIIVTSKPKPINDRVNVFRINAPGCSYQSTSILWSNNIPAGSDVQALVESKLNNNTLWDTDLFAGVKPNECGSSNGNELTNCPGLPQNMESVDLNYLKNNFFAFSPTSCLSTLIFKKRVQLIRNILNNWAVTECLQNINPNIPSIGNCYEPLVYKLILSTPPGNEKELLDSLIQQNLIYALLNKTQYTTFDEVAKRLALWQIKYYPLSGENALKGKIEGNIKAIEFMVNKVSASISPNGINITRDGYGFCKECVPVSAISLDVPLTSYVVVNFKDKVESYSAGSKARMPAIYALYLFNKDRREFLESSGKLMFDVAMLGLGVGEIKAAFEAYKAGRTAYQAYIGLKALTDAGMALGDMVVNNALAQNWQNTPEGRARLERWNTITMYWAMGSISATALDAALTKYCSPSNKVVINESKFNELADELEGVKASLTWIDELTVGLPLGAREKIIGWIDEGLDVNKLKNSFNVTTNKSDLFNTLNTAKSINHRKVILGDYLTIPGVTQGNYVNNSTDNVTTNIVRTIGDKTLALYPGQAKTFVKNNTFIPKPSLEIVEDLGNGIQLIKVKSGTKLYRVFDGYKPWDDITMTGNTLPNGSFWTFEKPTQISDVIEGTAVMPEWNGMTKIIEIEVPESGLYGWYGKAARQPASKNTSEFYLKGNTEQIILNFKENKQSVSSIATSIAQAPWIK
jgi:hypothetical protein